MILLKYFRISIASVAFINTGKNRGFFKRNQCDYGTLLSEFFGSSCAPGALDLAHGSKGSVENLCSLCEPSIPIIGTPVLPSIGVSLFHTDAPPLIRFNLGKILLVSCASINRHSIQL